MQKEINIEQSCVKWTKDRGGMLIKQTAFKGCPDRLLICPGGNMVFIEFKDPKGHASKLQEYYIKKLNKMGVDTYICRSLDEFKEIYFLKVGGVKP